MTMPTAHSDAAMSPLLEEAVGYLNFSSGASDPKFLRALNALFATVERGCDETQQPKTESDYDAHIPTLEGHLRISQNQRHSARNEVLRSQIDPEHLTIHPTRGLASRSGLCLQERKDR